METVNGKAFLPDGVNEAQYRIVTVPVQLRIEHGTSLIAYGPLGKQYRTAGQQGIVIYNAGNGIASQQKQVNIPAVCLPVCIPLPVIAFLTAHVKAGLIKIVVEHSHGLPGTAA